MSNTMQDRTAYKILVVDDDESQLYLIRNALTAPDFELREISNSRDVLGVLGEEHFDAVLLDYAMPEISGVDLCKIIVATPQFYLLPVIIHTAHTESRIVIECLDAGAVGFVSKGIKAEELAARVLAIAANRRMFDYLDNAESIIMTLAKMVEARDSSTSDHCERLVNLGAKFAQALNLNEHERTVLRRAAVLHDIGKIVLPDSILLKPGALTAEEYETVKMHSTVGADLCKLLVSLRHEITVIRHHHEAWNGSGYPEGLVGRDIPYLARVFQILDIFDALSHKRSYKDAYPLEKVVRIIREETDKGKCDPQLVGIFLNEVIGKGEA